MLRVFLGHTWLVELYEHMLILDLDGLHMVTVFLEKLEVTRGATAVIDVF